MTVVRQRPMRPLTLEAAARATRAPGGHPPVQVDGAGHNRAQDGYEGVHPSVTVAGKTTGARPARVPDVLPVEAQEPKPEGAGSV